MSLCLRAAAAQRTATAAAATAASSVSATRRRRLCTHPLTQRGPDSADVVIIGGGIVGVSTAYHLAKAGVKDVVLLEKTELTAGSTWHAAGLVTYFHPGINVRRVHHYSLQLYQQLHAAADSGVGLHTPGSLRVASTQLRMDEAKYQMARSGWCQAEQQLLDRQQCLRLCPLLNPQLVMGGIFTPGDGHIDPYSVTMAMAAAARALGVAIYQNCEVRATRQAAGGTWVVGTDHGDIAATHVVNAAGFHARDVGKLAGLDLPIVPVHHQYCITAAMPQVAELKEEIPVLRDLDGSYYLRQEKQGLLVGPYESADSMVLCDDWYDNGVPSSFGRELFAEDLSRLMPHLERAMEMVPLLQEAQIQTTVAGPITYNAENAPLLGPVSGLSNYWLMAGFGYGIAHAGGVGKFVADWIAEGEPPYELIELDANRYGWWADRQFVLAKARETYGLNNAVGFPKEERPAGRPTKRGSGELRRLLADEGAQFGFHNGWEQPHWFAEGERRQLPQQATFRRGDWFEAARRESLAVTERVGVIDLSPFAKFRISGRRAAEFLDLTTANFLPRLGRCCVTHALTPKAKVFAELTLTRTKPQEFLAISGASSEQRDLWWLRHSARRLGFGDGDGDDLEIRNVTDAFACFGVAGPLSRRLLQPLAPDVDFSPAAFAAMRAVPATIGGVRCLATRLSYSGELGWELHCDKADAVELFSAIRGAAGPLGGASFGAFAMNSLRIEKGFRMWGAEMNCDVDPLSAGLDAFVRLGKRAAFVGKDALLRLGESGLRRRLQLLRVDCSGDVDPEGNETVWCGGGVVGNTTSGSFGFTTNCSLAFAYLPAEMGPGHEVQVELLGSKWPAVVLDGPPVLPEPQRKSETTD